VDGGADVLLIRVQMFVLTTLAVAGWAPASHSERGIGVLNIDQLKKQNA